MLPWSRITELDNALTRAVRECDLLSRRVDWFAQQAKADAKTHATVKETLESKNYDLQTLLAQEQRTNGTYFRDLQTERAELFRRIKVLESQQAKNGT
jgi:hypothetical protein